MKKIILISASALVIAFVFFRLGLVWEYHMRTEHIIDRWEKMFSWTDEEGQTFLELVKGFEFSPEEAASLYENIGRFNEVQLIAMEEDRMFTTLTCMLILVGLEKGNVADAKEYCINNVANYYVQYTMPEYYSTLSPIQQQNVDKVIQSIEKRMQEYPALKDEIDRHLAETKEASD